MKETLNNTEPSNSTKPVLCDVLVCKEMGIEFKFLDTISMLYLDEFEKRVSWKTKNRTYTTIRNRLRKALNECYLLGYCNKYRIGTNLYQTGDSFGGKSCLVYDFFSKNIT
jgi:hypothetical protein